MRFLVFFLILLPFDALAQERAQEPSDPKKLGLVAGAASACGAHKQLYRFEEIVSRIFANKAKTPEIEKKMITEYAKGKAESFISQTERKRMPCREVVDSFSKMPIFKFQLYSDGSLKTPEGKFLFPPSQTALAPDAERVY